MFAWIDVLWLVAGVALGFVFKDKLTAALHGAEGYVVLLENKLAAAEAVVKAKLTKTAADVQADVKKVEATVQADINTVKTAAATIQKTV